MSSLLHLESIFREVKVVEGKCSQKKLIDAVTNFQNRMNTNPIAISDRLWVKKHLEPEEEKLRVSK